MTRLALAVIASTVLLAGTAHAATFVAYTGESVEVVVPPGQEERGQQVADLLASFPHGPELAGVTVSVLGEADASSRCFGAVACYFGLSRTIVIPDSTADYQWEQALAHEYAHHIALHRLNSPWRAFDWGAKYWASATGVCAKSQEGLLFDGYEADPGEGFAEAYRMLVAARTPTWTSFPLVVDETLFPMGAAIQAAVLQDVEQPWTAPSTRSWTRRLGAGQSVRLAVRTPLDGDLSLRLVAGRGSIAVDGTTGRRVDRLVCGKRSWNVRVKAATAGVLRVSITVP